MTKTPENAAAFEIQRLRSVNTDIDEQIRVLRTTQDNNSELIGLLSHTAAWGGAESAPVTEPVEDHPADESPAEDTLTEPVEEPETPADGGGSSINGGTE